MNRIITRIQFVLIISFLAIFSISCVFKKELDTTDVDHDEILEGDYAVDPISFSSASGMFYPVTTTPCRNLESVVGLDKRNTQSVMLYFDIDKTEYLLGGRGCQIDILSKYMLNPDYNINDLGLSFKPTRLSVSRGILYNFDIFERISKDEIPLENEGNVVFKSFTSSKVKDLLSNKEYNINIDLLINNLDASNASQGFVIFIDKGYVKEFANKNDVLYIFDTQVYGIYDVIKENNELYVLFDSRMERTRKSGDVYTEYIDYKFSRGPYPIYNELVKIYTENEYEVNKTEGIKIIKRSVKLDDLISLTKSLPDLVESKFVRATDEDINNIESIDVKAINECIEVYKIIDTIKNKASSLYHLTITESYYIVGGYIQEEEKGYYRYNSSLDIDFIDSFAFYRVLKGTIDKDLITDDALNVSFTIYTKPYGYKLDLYRSIYVADEYDYSELAMVISKSFLSGKDSIVFASPSNDYLDYIKVKTIDQGFDLIFRNPYKSVDDDAIVEEKMKRIFGSYYENLNSSPEKNTKLDLL